MGKFLCCCGFYVGEEQLCMTGTEDGCVAFYSIANQKAAVLRCGEAGEIVLALDALPHGDVAVGMMGSKNLFSVVCFFHLFRCVTPCVLWILFKVE